MRLFGVKVMGDLKVEGRIVHVNPTSWLGCVASAHPPAAEQVVATTRNDSGHTIQTRRCAICGTSTLVDVSLSEPSYRDRITLIPN
jgi:hypothetical protein